MGTLVICMTDGCVRSVIRPIVDKHWWYFFYWMSYLLLTMIGVMNLIVGILCPLRFSELTRWF